MRAVLADAILLLHFGFVLFVVGGLALTWIGAAAGWAWVRNFWFRAAHLGAIAFVAGEAPPTVNPRPNVPIVNAPIATTLRQLDIWRQRPSASSSSAVSGWPRRCLRSAPPARRPR